jgi:hypothetical protein
MLVQYDFDNEYLPKQESIKFFNWDNLMFEKDVNITPRMHYQIIDTLFSEHRHVVCQIARDHAKSTLTSQKAPLYVAMFGNLPNFGYVENIVIISNTFEQANQQLKSMIAYYNQSDKLQQFLNIKKDVEGKVILENKKGQTVQITALGAGMSFRGTKFGIKRPQWIIGDDLQPDECIYSKEANDKLKDWWAGTVLKAVDHNKYKITVIGTPMSEIDLLAGLTNTKSYNAFKCPIAKEFSLDESKIIPAWESRFPAREILAMYEDDKSLGREAQFFREMFLEVKNKETQIFLADWFKEYDYKELMSKKYQYNFFTSIDLAVSKKEKSDRTVIYTIAVDSAFNWYLVGLFAKRCTPTEAIDELFSQARKFKPIEVRAEKAALQQVLNHFIDLKMVRENTHFRLEPLIRNSNMQKEARILGLQPKFRARQIFFPKDMSIEEV